MHTPHTCLVHMLVVSMLVRAVMRVRRMVRCMMTVRQIMPVRATMTVKMAAMRTNISVSMAACVPTLPAVSMSAVRTALCMADMAEKTKRGHCHHAGEA
jgi:hypothetical protein